MYIHIYVSRAVCIPGALVGAGAGAQGVGAAGAGAGATGGAAGARAVAGAGAGAGTVSVVVVAAAAAGGRRTTGRPGEGPGASSAVVGEGERGWFYQHVISMPSPSYVWLLVLKRML